MTTIECNATNRHPPRAWAAQPQTKHRCVVGTTQQRLKAGEATHAARRFPVPFPSSPVDVKALPPTRAYGSFDQDLLLVAGHAFSSMRALSIARGWLWPAPASDALADEAFVEASERMAATGERSQRVALAVLTSSSSTTPAFFPRFLTRRDPTPRTSGSSHAA